MNRVHPWKQKPKMPLIITPALAPREPRGFGIRKWEAKGEIPEPEIEPEKEPETQITFMNTHDRSLNRQNGKKRPKPRIAESRRTGFIARSLMVNSNPTSLRLSDYPECRLKGRRDARHSK